MSAILTQFIYKYFRKKCLEKLCLVLIHGKNSIFCPSGNETIRMKIKRIHVMFLF